MTFPDGINMITVGIYGRIGSGKSVVAGVFAENGASVISADRIGKEVVDQNESVLDALIDTFGKGIIDSQGTLKRRELGRIAFSSQENRAKLDAIVHPALLKRLRSKVAEHRAAGRSSIVVVDAALILNWGIERELDVLVCVTAPKSSQIERMVRSGLSEQEAQSRLNSQIPEDKQASRADYVIHNDGTMEMLREKALGVLDRIKRGEKTV